MDRTAFFNNVRSNVFDGALSQPQVDGINAILDAAAEFNPPAEHVANILSQVKRETGGYMSPIKETVMPYHKDKNPSDKTVIARLDNAWKNGDLGKVSSPYWRDGWFGRGQIQISHKANYQKLGKMIGVDLVKNPDAALELGNSAKIAVVGMLKGAFTGKKLSDYKFPEAVDAPVADNPRRIVNGNDGSDKEVAKFHKAFYYALVNAGYGEEPAPVPIEPTPVEAPELPQRTRGVVIAEIEALLQELKSLGG